MFSQLYFLNHILNVHIKALLFKILYTVLKQQLFLWNTLTASMPAFLSLFQIFTKLPYSHLHLEAHSIPGSQGPPLSVPLSSIFFTLVVVVAIITSIPSPPLITSLESDTNCRVCYNETDVELGKELLYGRSLHCKSIQTIWSFPHFIWLQQQTSIHMAFINQNRSWKLWILFV